ncbi:MAG: AAC(3) family N-acetyltransferase [Christensenellales bacterium]
MPLIQDLEALGLCPGDTLLMHSSFRALGPLEGGIGALIEALRRVLGERGTLLVPALSYAYVTEENPVFDARRTASCIGAVPEYFRRLPEVRRSLSPTHSVCALGRLAGDLTGDQLLDSTPVGPHSPFRRLAEAGGKLLFLGCGLRPNTSMHGVEELVTPPYLFRPGLFPFTVVDEAGRAHDILCRRHSFQIGDTVYEQRYERVLDLLDGDEKRRGRIGQADCFLLDARAVWMKAEAALRRDAFCLVTPIKRA